jgi:AcrR family transcriptional regulator
MPRTRPPSPEPDSTPEPGRRAGRGSRRASAEATRERILAAAVDLFAERGYAATGVDALCRRAGVAKTGLYWEFQNKVGLLNAVIDQVVAEWVDEIREASSAGAPRDRLDTALTALRKRVSERPELFRVLLVVLAERTQVDDEARAALMRFYKSAHTSLRDGIQGSVGGALPEAELGHLCDVILCMMQGAFLRAQVYGDADMERLFGGIRSCILLLVRELMANTQGESMLAGSVKELIRPRQPAG